MIIQNWLNTKNQTNKNYFCEKPFRNYFWPFPKFSLFLFFAVYFQLNKLYSNSSSSSTQHFTQTHSITDKQFTKWNITKINHNKKNYDNFCLTNKQKKRKQKNLTKNKKTWALRCDSALEFLWIMMIKKTKKNVRRDIVNVAKKKREENL